VPRHALMCPSSDLNKCAVKLKSRVAKLLSFQTKVKVPSYKQM
jgi:hypothetical protein